LAEAAVKLKLKHVVITSVTRDDLKDGGASQFAKCIKEVKFKLPEASIEILIPDFKYNKSALDTVMNANPDIVNHNIETVPELYADVRPMANYTQSLNVLEYVKKQRPDILTKSGFMLGLGEELSSVFNIMNDLRKINCDILTVGQYLPPSHNHAILKSYIQPEIFNEIENYGKKIGFIYIASGPYVRSSYNALDVFTKIKTTNYEIY